MKKVMYQIINDFNAKQALAFEPIPDDLRPGNGKEMNVTKEILGKG